jgi:Transposase DDE domain
VLDLGLAGPGSAGAPLEIVSSQASHLWEGLCRAYGVLGFDRVLDGDEVLRDLVLARIIEPSSKIDAERVLTETGVAAASYRTVKRRLPVIAKPVVRRSLSAACAARAGLGPASLVLFDVSTLYFETDVGDGFREPGFSKERRLEPQITLGLLTDATGFPLTVEAFEGNKAETATMLPVINAFKAAHNLSDVTVVADAGTISEANQVALQAAGLSYILGARIPHLPDVVREWRDKHPGEQIRDGLVLAQPWPATSSEKARGIPDRVIYYQFRHDRARKTLRGIDEQVAKAQRAVDGHLPDHTPPARDFPGRCRSPARRGGPSPAAPPPRPARTGASWTRCARAPAPSTTAADRSPRAGRGERCGSSTLVSPLRPPSSTPIIMLANTFTASRRAGPANTDPGAAAVTAHRSSRRASNSALIAEISASSVATCSPRASRARTTATRPAGTYRARRRPAGFGAK